MRLLLLTLGCVGVFFGGQQGEEIGKDSGVASDDTGDATDSGHDTDSDSDTGDELDLIEGIYNGTFLVNADVACEGTVTLEVSGSSLGGSAECGGKDYTISGNTGSASISRDDGSSWSLDLSAPDDSTLMGGFEGDDSAGVATSGQFEALFDGD